MSATMTMVFSMPRADISQDAAQMMLSRLMQEAFRELDASYGSNTWSGKKLETGFYSDPGEPGNVTVCFELLDASMMRQVKDTFNTVWDRVRQDAFPHETNAPEEDARHGSAAPEAPIRETPTHGLHEEPTDDDSSQGPVEPSDCTAELETLRESTTGTELTPEHRRFVAEMWKSGRNVEEIEDALTDLSFEEQFWEQRARQQKDSQDGGSSRGAGHTAKKTLHPLLGLCIWVAIGALGYWWYTSPPGIADLSSTDTETFLQAAEFFGKQRNSEAVNPLIHALASDHPTVKLAAIDALAEIGDSKAVEPLIEVLRSERGLSRRAAIEALGSIGDPKCVESLVEFRRTLTVECLDYEDRYDVHNALIRIGEPAVEPLIKALADDSSEVRSSVAWMLGKIGDSRAVNPLQALAEDDDGTVRDAAANALQEIQQGGKDADR